MTPYVESMKQGVAGPEPTAVSASLRAPRGSIASRSATVAVIGQGYVGFPLAQRIAEKGFVTLGIDSSPEVEQRCRR